MTEVVRNVDEEGTVRYYKKGTEILHREDGPAVQWVDGSNVWYQNDKLHREDGPAVQWIYGSNVWYQNDKLHREGGPAVECADGTKEWYINGQRHREDGPAIEYADGSKSWYLNGKKVTEEEVMGNSNKFEIVTNAFILKVGGESIPFETRAELLEYMESKL